MDGDLSLLQLYGIDREVYSMFYVSPVCLSVDLSLCGMTYVISIGQKAGICVSRLILCIDP